VAELKRRWWGSDDDEARRLHAYDLASCVTRVAAIPGSQAAAAFDLGFGH
jgi:hypothetical protein